MKKILNAELTKHVEIYRANRVDNIINTVGIGQIVKEEYRRTFDRVTQNLPGVYICVTDTGITLIKDETKEKIITMYVTSYRELISLYGGEKNIPKFLRKKVDQNQTKYIKNGKTIWAR